MPPTARLSPRQSVRRGLRVAGMPGEGLLAFDFKPSVGIAAAQIDKLGVDIRSFREPLRRVIREVMIPSFRKNFQTGGRPDSWEPLSDATLEIRERLGGRGGKPLIRTGSLMGVVQQQNIWTVTQNNATIRSLPNRVWYGAIHQEGFGGSGGGKKMSTYLKKAGGDAKEAQRLLDDDIIMAMRSGKKVGGGERSIAEIPQRQFILIQEEDMDEIEEVFVRWLTERVAAAGFRPGV